MTVVDHPFLTGVESVAVVLDELATLEPAFLPVAQKRELLLALARVASRVQALQARVVACAGDVAAAEGHRDVASWLVHRAQVSGAVARRLLRLGESCDRRWHRLGAALVAGEVSVDQGLVIAAALDDLASGADLVQVDAEEWSGILDRAEEHLLVEAGRFGPRALARLGERLLAVVAPEVAEAVEAKALAEAERYARRRTELRLQSLGDGTAVVRARVPEAVAVRLRTALEAFTNPRNPRNVSGPGGAGRAGGAGGDGRVVRYERRLGEAFCSLLESLDPARLPLHGGDATTLVVTMDLATLTEGLGSAVLADGSRISAGEARRLACTAGLVPAVFGSGSLPLDLGRTSRLFSAGQRKGLALRDRECRGEGCTIPSTWCEAHHLDPWGRGGRTDLAAGVLLCSHHHHLIHDDRYLHQLLPNGDIRFTRRR